MIELKLRHDDLTGLTLRLSRSGMVSLWWGPKPWHESYLPLGVSYERGLPLYTCLLCQASSHASHQMVLHAMAAIAERGDLIYFMEISQMMEKIFGPLSPLPLSGW